MKRLKMVGISEEAHHRIKLFSAKYELPMRKILDWFIFSLLDEEGEPDMEGIRETLNQNLRNLF